MLATWTMKYIYIFMESTGFEKAIDMEPNFGTRPVQLD